MDRRCGRGVGVRRLEEGLRGMPRPLHRRPRRAGGGEEVMRADPATDQLSEKPARVLHLRHPASGTRGPSARTKRLCRNAPARTRLLPASQLPVPLPPPSPPTHTLASSVPRFLGSSLPAPLCRSENSIPPQPPSSPPPPPLLSHRLAAYLLPEPVPEEYHSRLEVGLAAKE